MTWRIIIFILALLVATPLAFARDRIVMTSGDWPPYISDTFKFGGFGSKVATEAFALAGIEVDYVYMPWKRGLASVRSGQYEGALGWSRTKEREQDLYYSDPIFTHQTVFFHRKDTSFDWEKINDVASMNIGATLGYSYYDLLRPYVRAGEGKLDEAPTDEMNLLKLAAKRIDIFPCSKAVGYYLLRTRLLPGIADGITHHPKPLMDKPVHIVISRKVKDGAEIIRRFNEGLAKLRENGAYAQYEMESLSGAYIPE